MEVRIKKWQRSVLIALLVLTTVFVAVASNQILNDNVFSWWWCIPALGWSAITTFTAYFLTRAGSGDPDAGVNASTGGRYVALCGGGVVVVGALTVVSYIAVAEAMPEPEPVAAPHPTCVRGSICLWPERGFGGEVWTWQPGADADGPVPARLRDRIGSFEAQATGCFVDSESKEERPIKMQDWSGRYVEKFGRQADTVKAACRPSS
ncbi:hypothetical protein [Nonomuraea aridisoli]|uniref:hypothetical protein n=1 Tax=Nonomuraea aridisoli TaxID=2070368 RepID=UPI0011B9393C|nr:hypothetical protein [Nonomuraea aridisoli]